MSPKWRKMPKKISFLITINFEIQLELKKLFLRWYLYQELCSKIGQTDQKTLFGESPILPIFCAFKYLRKCCFYRQETNKHRRGPSEKSNPSLFRWTWEKLRSENLEKHQKTHFTHVWWPLKKQVRLRLRFFDKIRARDQGYPSIYSLVRASHTL